MQILLKTNYISQMVYVDNEQLNRMRDLQRAQTDAEKLLWFELRRKRFEGHKFRRQHPVGPFILDFYCSPKRLAVELDGGQHNMASGQEYDARRTAYLQSRKIRVIRFWNNDVLFNKKDVLQHLWNELEKEV